MAQVISFTSQKGGVAKTSSVVNLGAVIARILGPNKVLIVDLDPQANATGTLIDVAFANGPRGPRNQTPVIKEVLQGKASLGDALRVVELGVIPNLKVRATNLHILPSHPELAGIETELYLDGGTFRLADALDNVQSFYDVILIDCPANFGAFTRSALLAANHVVIPVSPGPYELVGIGLIRQEVDKVRSSNRLNPDLAITGVLPTKFKNTRMSQNTISALNDVFEKQVLPIIPERVAVQEAAAAGMDILAYAPESDAAAAYGKAAIALLKRVQLTKKVAR